MYPFVEAEEEEDDSNGGEDTMTKQFICMVAERPTFERMVQSEVTPEVEARAAAALETIHCPWERYYKQDDKYGGINQREQAFFDVFDADGVKDKIMAAKRDEEASQLWHNHRGREKFLLNQANSKLKALNEKLSEANSGKLKSQISQVEERIEHIGTIKGISVPFRNEAAFCELVGLLQPHLLRQDAGKPIKANEQAEMDGLREQMDQYIEDARLWFEMTKT